MFPLIPFPAINFAPHLLPVKVVQAKPQPQVGRGRRQGNRGWASRSKGVCTRAANGWVGGAAHSVGSCRATLALAQASCAIPAAPHPLLPTGCHLHW